MRLSVAILIFSFFTYAKFDFCPLGRIYGDMCSRTPQGGIYFLHNSRGVEFKKGKLVFRTEDPIVHEPTEWHIKNTIQECPEGDFNEKKWIKLEDKGKCIPTPIEIPRFAEFIDESGARHTYGDFIYGLKEKPKRLLKFPNGNCRKAISTNADSAKEGKEGLSEITSDVY